MSYLDDIAEGMSTFFEDNAISITYNGRSIQAVPAGTQWNDIDRVKEQFGMLASSRDYIVRASDFPPGKEPKPKDVIKDVGSTWKVYTLTDGECWRPMGNEYTGLIRIHCKR